MKPRAFIIYGWSGEPDHGWYPWIESQLSSKGYDVISPLMPDIDYPKIKPWVEKLMEVVGEPRPSDVFIGHSIGCQTIWRFLEQLSEGQKVNKVIMVAPWVKLTNLESEEEWKTAEPWLNVPIDFIIVKSKADHFASIFSDNDPFVPVFDNRKLVEEKLGSEVILLNNRGHLNEDAGVKELPEILKFL